MQLWREIRALGYPGTSRQVHRWLQKRRRKPALTQTLERRRQAAHRIVGRQAPHTTARSVAVQAPP